MSCSWSSNVMSRQVTPSYHIISHGIIISYHITSSYHIISHDVTERNRTKHYIISYYIPLHNIEYWYTLMLQLLQILRQWYRWSISQRYLKTSHNIKCYRNIELQSQSQCSYSTVEYKTIQDNTITGQSRAALLSTVRYYHRIDDTSWLVVLRVISVEQT